MDVHRLSYGRPSVPLWASISFQTDINKNLCGRPSAFLRTSGCTSVDVHQFLYTCLAVPSLTSFNFLTDIHQYICGRPLVFNCLSSSAILDVSNHGRSISTSVGVHYFSYGCASVSKLTSVRFYMYIFLYRRPLVPLWMSI